MWEEICEITIFSVSSCSRFGDFGSRFAKSHVSSHFRDILGKFEEVMPTSQNEVGTIGVRLEPLNNVAMNSKTH